jgi:Protein of unknown function (DUF1592)/Protein of unknown function (DUF1588)/Protein of unknown function (DUF1595)/Protein of unknown function (DUF1587)/Protein of unknown function (DUF1585)
MANGLASVAVLLLSVGCTTETPAQNMGVAGSNPNSMSSGGGSGTTTGGNGPGPGGGASGGTTAVCTTPSVPRAPLRRLIRFEYNNTVRDLLKVTSKPADALPGEEAGSSGFGNDADALGVSRLLIDGYRGIAEQLAKEKTKDAATANATAGCDPVAMGEQACSTQFLNQFLTLAFRRPVTAEDVTSYGTTFTKGREVGGDFATGVRAVLARVLQSPQFLYRVELGETVDAASGLGRPTAHEMASRLSYMLWGSMPDEALRTAAEQGKLSTKAGVQAEAERLLGDNRAHEVVRFFHTMLLGTSGLDHLERNADFYPKYKAGMGSLFRQETENFLEDVIWKGNGDLASIYSAPYTFVNGPLAQYYGIPGVTGDAFQKVQLDGTRRAGLLTQASILSVTTPGSRTSPVVRGKWVYTKLLCGKIGDPPPNVPKLPEPTPGLSVRDRLETHRSVEPCKSCHRLMDPIGLGFEHFDGAGMWRDTDNDLPVDASGEIPYGDAAGKFDGVVELGQKLAASVGAQNCFVGHWMSFAYGRGEDAQDACTRQQLQDSFAQSKGNVRGLLVALTQTDAFLYRPIVTPGR